MTEVEYSYDRFWEYGKWTYRLANGKQQFKVLVSHGLQPHHYLLDIGCGWLRGGLYFISYLDRGHYYGFDKGEKQLNRGRVLLAGHKRKVRGKRPTIGLVYNTKMIRKFVGRAMIREGFDYMIAKSVFTHTDPYMSERLFVGIIPFLKDTGKFFATFYESKSGKIEIDKFHNTRTDEYNGAYYPASFFYELAEKHKMNMERIEVRDKDNHRQKWVYFARR